MLVKVRKHSQIKVDFADWFGALTLSLITVKYMYIYVFE